MMKSKQTKTSEHEDGVDMISNLPDHLLHLILSKITSTEEVIQTSILSTRWRYLWTLVPSIHIDITRGLDPHKVLDYNKFKEFVYWVLLNKSHNVDGFRLWCGNYYNMSTVGRWIHVAVMRKVQVLDLMFRPMEDSEDIELPHCLVTCGSLELFRLCLLKRPLKLPKFTGFPALTALELIDVDLNNDLVKYFLESCPLLEELSLVDCIANELVISCPKLKDLRIYNRKVVYVDVEDPENDLEDSSMCLSLKISCPKLVFLKLTGYVAFEFLFERLHSLKEAVILPSDLFIYEEPHYYLFKALSHVEVLSINICWINQCYVPGIDDPISLPNLKILELTVDDLHILIPFLTCFPNLESLHLFFPKDIYGLEKWELDEDEMSILTRHLKIVKFLEFDGGKPELDVARALLENGNELEEMVFDWVNVERVNERSMETMMELSKFHKASSTVKVRAVIEQP